MKHSRWLHGFGLGMALLTTPAAAMAQEIPVVTHLNNLESLVGLNWTNNTSAKRFSPQTEFTLDLDGIAFESTFETSFVASLVAVTNQTVLLYPISVIETNLPTRRRIWFNAEEFKDDITNATGWSHRAILTHLVDPVLFVDSSGLPGATYTAADAQGDPDGDGLASGREIFLYGTSAWTNDTDGDNLLDNLELLVYGTAALKGDSDGDGMSDGAEVGAGLDPTDPSGVNGAEGDPDLDGINNADELALGLSPLLFNVTVAATPTVEIKSRRVIREKFKDFPGFVDVSPLVYFLKLDMNSTEDWDDGNQDTNGVCHFSYGERTTHSRNLQVEPFTMCLTGGAEFTRADMGVTTNGYDAIYGTRTRVEWTNSVATLTEYTGIGEDEQATGGGTFCGLYYIGSQYWGYNRRLLQPEYPDAEVSMNRFSVSRKGTYPCDPYIEIVSYNASEPYTTEMLEGFIQTDLENLAASHNWKDIDWDKGVSSGTPGDVDCYVSSPSSEEAELCATVHWNDEASFMLIENKFHFKQSTATGVVYELTWRELFAPIPNPLETNTTLRVGHGRFVGTGGDVYIGDPGADSNTTGYATFAGGDEDFLLESPGHGDGTVTIQVVSLAIDPPIVEVCAGAGGTADFDVLGRSCGAGPVTWGITGPHAASIDTNGTVTYPDGGGTYLITATKSGGPGCTAQATLSVIHVEIDPAVTNVSSKGEYVDFDLTEDSYAPFGVTWSIDPSDTNVWIDSAGRVYYPDIGATYTITATTKGNSSCTATAALHVIKVDLEGYQAWRGSEDDMIPEEEEETPGFLVTQDVASGDDPREAKLIFKALPDAPGLKRIIRVAIENAGSGSPQLELHADNQVPVILANGAEHEVDGVDKFSITNDAIYDVFMYNPNDWGANTYATVKYEVEDQDGSNLGADTNRLLRPVVMAIGDSLTFGQLGESQIAASPNPHPSWISAQCGKQATVNRTPPLHPYRFPRGACPATWPQFTPKESTDCGLDQDWISYPAATEWELLAEPYNVPSNRADLGFQGYRGYLAADLPGFKWVGIETGGHGPDHLGFPGGGRSSIISRTEVVNAVQTAPCYAILLYCVGMNDTGRNSIELYWADGFDKILDQDRSDRGRTLAVAVKVPEPSDQGSKKTQVQKINTRIDQYIISPGGPNASPDRDQLQFRYVASETALVPHSPQDDGIHFLNETNNASGGKQPYQIMAEQIRLGITAGLAQPSGGE